MPFVRAKMKKLDAALPSWYAIPYRFGAVEKMGIAEIKSIGSTALGSPDIPCKVLWVQMDDSPLTVGHCSRV